MIVMIMLSACAKSGDLNIKTNNIDDIVVEVSIDEAKDLIDETMDLIILDVRTEEEYNEGHIKGAILIPYDKIAEREKDIEGLIDKSILVYCRTGRRSALAIESLKEYGFPRIYHMHEGISKWTYDLEK